MTIKRKGALRRADVSADIKQQLNAGTLEALTLAEVLVIDLGQLLAAVAPELCHTRLQRMHRAAPDGITRRVALAGQLLHEQFGVAAYQRFVSHPSDMVRSWVANIIALLPDATLAQKLILIRPLADDSSPNVREWAWMALRPAVAAELKLGIELLTPWTQEVSPNLRRFATEVTRPRGVWCQHINELKKSPELALALLEPLRADPSVYVQNSVANWLNDASKTQPAWVAQLCKRWLKASSNKITERICKRALRTLNKAKSTTRFSIL